MLFFYFIHSFFEPFDLVSATRSPREKAPSHADSPKTITLQEFIEMQSEEPHLWFSRALAWKDSINLCITRAMIVNRNPNSSQIEIDLIYIDKRRCLIAVAQFFPN